MGIVPAVWAGNLQVEDVAAKKQMSEYIAQKFGGNINYLKKTADDLQTQIDSFLASGPVSCTTIFIGAHQTTLATPNGKRWWCVFIEEEFGSNVQGDGPKPVGFNQITWFSPGSPAVFNASISGSILTVADFGHEWSGFGFYES